MTSQLAYELLAKLRYLTLVGQDDEGELEWIGTDHQFKMVKIEEECILRDWEVNQSWEVNQTFKI